MKVYIVTAWDSMASNHGDYEIDRVYLDEAKARAYKEEQDAETRRREPHMKYPMLAQVLTLEVTE